MSVFVSVSVEEISLKYGGGRQQPAVHFVHSVHFGPTLGALGAKPNRCTISIYKFYIDILHYVPIHTVVIAIKSIVWLFSNIANI